MNKIIIKKKCPDCGQMIEYTEIEEKISQTPLEEFGMDSEEGDYNDHDSWTCDYSDDEIRTIEEDLMKAFKSKRPDDYNEDW